MFTVKQKVNQLCPVVWQIQSVNHSLHQIVATDCLPFIKLLKENICQKLSELLVVFVQLN